MLTVGALVDELGLTMAAGAEHAGNQVRWVHISEEADPTPWLAGGELLLTAGTTLATAGEQRRFLHRLAENDISGLGFGVVESRERPPQALLEEAERLRFPLFEIPHSMPFIAVTKTAIGRLVDERYEVLRRGIAVQRRLEHLMLEDSGLEEIAREISSAIAGSVLICGGGGQRLALHDPADAFAAPGAVAAIGEELARRESARPFIVANGRLPAGAFARPVVPPRASRAQAWIVVIADDGRLGELVRLVVQQASSLVGLELMRQTAASETERRLTSSVIADARAAGTPPAELARRLEPFGISGEVAVLAFAASGAEAERALQRSLGEEGRAAAVATQEIAGRELLCAIVETGEDDPVDLARATRGRLSAELGPLAAGVSRAKGPAQLWRSFQEAHWALGAAESRNGDGPGVGSWRDLGVESLLLSISDEDVLRLYCDHLLGDLGDDDSQYAGELLRSLEAFIEHNGQWERAARQLHCHRHTLRYRIRKVEELTGRDLGLATVRLEFWLALRARELAL
ncbi:MAG TPA: PucR family transcriptional regulator ligand-binding domain-containing protein [Solirubrobacterales bacterium]|nr:PucR family transcriptional regulator ligand-binding domain-containing protein [Solirubrobacterales bacterium]